VEIPKGRRGKGNRWKRRQRTNRSVLSAATEKEEKVEQKRKKRRAKRKAGTQKVATRGESLGENQPSEFVTSKKEGKRRRIAIMEV